ncbi:hypothetical protein ACP275_04G162900 [Erythranthe tilingii]
MPFSLALTLFPLYPTLLSPIHQGGSLHSVSLFSVVESVVDPILGFISSRASNCRAGFMK